MRYLTLLFSVFCAIAAWCQTEVRFGNRHRGNFTDVATSFPYFTYAERTIDFMSAHRDRYPALADSANYARIRSVESGYRRHKFPYVKTTDLSGKSTKAALRNGDVIGGVEVFTSTDLTHWHGPKQVMRIPDGNGLTGTVWAPEVHKHNDRYYLFATINSDIKFKDATVEGWPSMTHRGTQIFHSDSPFGPFVPFSPFVTTPIDWMALDGTLWVENERPYMVFCHEWVQTVDGTMEAVELRPDLSEMADNPFTLFYGSAPEWSTGGKSSEDAPLNYVTDGCYLYRTRIGKLLMIWSSFSHGDYAIGIAESVTGSVKGPWKQQKEPLFTDNGGHGMIFRDLDGQLNIVLHQPNWPAGAERAHIFPLEDCGDTLRLKN